MIAPFMKNKKSMGKKKPHQKVEPIFAMEKL